MTRLEEAMLLADKCWGKACFAEPQFVEEYLSVAEYVLIHRPIVMGDEFREQCRERGLMLPQSLHHNTWVSGVRALNIIGWIEPIQKVAPEQRHNHMETVTLWRSQIFGGKKSKTAQIDLFDE
jgi:hypothetical protein